VAVAECAIVARRVLRDESAPAAASRSIAVDVMSGTKSLRRREPQVQRLPSW
jgi:hypothetical protein